jgi:hypothetical protein
MNNTEKAILLILLSCFLILIRYYIIKYLHDNVSKNKLPYFGIISLLLILFGIYSIYISDKATHILTSTDSISIDIKDKLINNLRYNEILTYFNIGFWSIFTYLAFKKNKNAWNVLLYQTIIYLLSLGLMIKNNL